MGAVERFGLGSLSAYLALDRASQMYALAYHRLRNRETREAMET